MTHHISRRTSDVEINAETVDMVNVSAHWFTTGALSVERRDGLYITNGTANPGWVIASGTDKTCAYLVGGVLGHAVATGAEVPEPMASFLRDVQETYRDGLTHRYMDYEAQGARAARSVLGMESK